ncbi:MAG: hypothetical protein HY922_17625 [Elusimicrobia bacterium]|nr:hypothetical protein [Elusimicrobiota bacterium]
MTEKDEFLISKGSFLVDRERALSKLMRFQMPDARMFLLPLAQAAVASGARRLCVSPQAGGIELSFDGCPWRAPDLKDPYGCLFEDDLKGERARHRELAVGLLSVMRLKPEHVSIAFSDGTADHALYVKSVTEEHLESDLVVSPLTAASERYGQRVRMLIFVSMPGPFQREIEHLERACRHCPCAVEVDGRLVNPIPDPCEARLRLAFSKDGIEGEALLSPRTLALSRVELLTYGIRVAVEQMKLPSVQVSAWLRHDGFRKNISQTGIVKDERYEAAAALLRHEAEKLLLNAMREAGLLCKGVGRALRDPRQHERWIPWETTGLAGWLSGARERILADDSIERMSLVVAAARQTCLSRKAELWKGDGLLSMLTQAPLFFDVHAQPLSLGVIEDQRRWLGGVPFLPHLSDQVSEGLAVPWAVSAADKRFLEEFFGADARRLESFRAVSSSVELAPALEETNLLVKVSFRSGDIVGEAGLSLAPHAQASHIRWLQSGYPHAVTVWPLGGLRLEAVVDNPAITHAPRPGDPGEEVARSLAALMEAAPSAYRKIASEYDPSQSTPRQAMIREHLLDLAVKSWAPARGEWTAHAWLDEAKLFRDAQGRMLSMGDLREAAARGEKALLHPSPHPEKLREMTAGFPDHIRLLFEGSDLARILEPGKPQGQAAVRPVSARLVEDPALRGPEQFQEAEQQAERPAPPAQKQAQEKAEELAPAQPPAVTVAEKKKEPSSEDIGPEQAFRRLLHELSVRKACPLSPNEIDAVGFVNSRGGPLLMGSQGQGWSLNLEHPLARRAAVAGNLEESLPYLVSIFYTAINRARPDITDQQDIGLQAALAEHLLAADQGEKAD